MLISNAFAQAASAPAAATPAGFEQILIIFAMFAAVYFFMIRPQQKKAKEHRAMLEALAKGDEVVMQSGIAGRIVKIVDTYATVEIAENVEIKVQKQGIALILPKGTLKTL